MAYEYELIVLKFLFTDSLKIVKQGINIIKLNREFHNSAFNFNKYACRINRYIYIYIYILYHHSPLNFISFS
jgi:hypothetical protein